MRLGDEVKIGYSLNPAKRLLAVRGDYTSKVELVRVISGDKSTEKVLQRHYQDRRSNGDWFKFCPTMMTLMPPGSQEEELPLPATRDATKRGKLVQASGMTPLELKAWRDRIGLSQPQAAVALGIPVATLRGYEQSYRRAGNLPGWLDKLTAAIERDRTAA